MYGEMKKHGITHILVVAASAEMRYPEVRHDATPPSLSTTTTLMRFCVSFCAGLHLQAPARVRLQAGGPVVPLRVLPRVHQRGQDARRSARPLVRPGISASATKP